MVLMVVNGCKQPINNSAGQNAILNISLNAAFSFSVMPFVSMRLSFYIPLRRERGSIMVKSAECVS